MKPTKHTIEELNNCSRQDLIIMLMAMEVRADQLSQDMQELIEQLKIANQNRFGRKTERLDEIDGQMSFFNEAEKLSEDAPDILLHHGLLKYITLMLLLEQAACIRMSSPEANVQRIFFVTV
jgi:hypothetical protein